MLGFLVCCTALAPTALTMPPEPIGSELRAGAELARSGSPIERALGSDRQTLGTWFDGIRRRPTEWALRFSPELLSRWLGYLDEAEAWPEGEALRRWQGLRGELAGKAAFLVALTAYPKTATLDLIEAEPADVSNLGSPGTGEGIRFSVTVREARAAASVRPLAYWRAREETQIRGYRWWLDVPFGGWLTPATMRDQPAPNYSLGEWYGAWYYIEAPLPAGDPQLPIELRVYAPSKSRHAVWDAPRRPANPSDPTAPARPAPSPKA